ncbi:replication protein P [Atlantibacter subterraneus]|uniref:replication protein P n=1 Tax=Atlantibacter subterraneus TaxID=255519 RepID=UPI0022EB84E7|nr:replication protein P [Atlantibacter subterranea]MDA3133599.1 replication protein P [Atlantibacter subterranea]
MKNIGTEMRNFDREHMRRVAMGMPEQQSEPRQEHAAQVFNELFRQLRAAFPASMSVFKTQADIDEFRRQWLLAFAENGITSFAQVDAGMRIARTQEKPFMPSPGQFVAWCRAEESAAVGLPDQNELVKLVYEYCRNRSRYNDAESYPWPDNDITPRTVKYRASYWLVTTLYQQMRSYGLTDMELNRKAGEELAKMVKRIRAGEVIPEPVARLPVLGSKPVTREQGMAKIQEIRAKFGLKGGRV